jgi:large repetitive protein
LAALATPLSAFGASQTISFDAIPNQIFGGSPFVIAAQASSGLPVSRNVATPGVCKTAANLVTLLSAGPCFITASQAGNSA